MPDDEMKLRKKHFLLISSAIVLIVFVTVTAAAFSLFRSSSADFSYVPGNYVPGKIIVKFKPNFIPGPTFLSQYGLANPNKILGGFNFSDKEKTAVENVGMDRVYLLDIPSTQKIPATLLNTLNSDPSVEYAQPDYELSLADTAPNDPLFSQQWNMRNIAAPAAWSVATNSDIVVGVIDSGIDIIHPDLADNVWVNPNASSDTDFPGDVHGWNFIASSSDVTDNCGHGTHVAGIIGAVGNNATGTAGVNWKVKLAAIKIFNSSRNGEGQFTACAGDESTAIRGISYAISRGFKITNNSWIMNYGNGGNEPIDIDRSLLGAVETAREAGDLFVAAAGNDGTSRVVYPAGFGLNNEISVAAATQNDGLASYSNYNSKFVDIAAPGGDSNAGIISTVPFGAPPPDGCSIICNPSGYGYLYGTSMATPHVAGAAGLYWAQNPTLSYLDVKNRILATADNVTGVAGKVASGRLSLGNIFSNSAAPPLAISNLAASNISTSSLTLSWTDVANANRYDVRHSYAPITAGNFSAAVPVTNFIVPSSAGSQETLTAGNLNDNKQYYFAVKAIDKTGNSSPISNVVTTTTTQAYNAVAFEDNVESGDNGWTTPGEWHRSNRRSGASPNTSWYFGNESTSNCLGNNSQYLSHSIDLRDIVNSHISFYNYIDDVNQNQNPVSADGQPASLYLLVSTSNLSGLNQMVWSDIYNDKGNDRRQWQRDEVDIPKFDGQIINIGFAASGLGNVNAFECEYVDDIRVEGNYSPPVAQPGGPYSGNQGQPIAFNASSSHDISGIITNYHWDFGDGSSATTTQAATTHTYASGGNYTATLIVNNLYIPSAPATTTVTVNWPPVANAGPDQFGELNKPLTFDGSSSTDKDSDIVSYRWEFGDGGSATGAIVTHAYGSVGNYTSTLTVTDKGGLSDSGAAHVCINAVNTITAAESAFCQATKTLLNK